MPQLEIIPMSLENANKFVVQFHRHNTKVRGHKFSIGCMFGDELVGVAIVGRPVARNLDDGRSLEVLRVCTKPTSPKGTSSKLYARCKRIGQMMGYIHIYTYTLEEESGATMRAINATLDGFTKAGEWTRKKRPRKSQPIYKKDKLRWKL